MHHIQQKDIICLKISENELHVTLMSYPATRKQWTQFEKGVISFQGAVKKCPHQFKIRYKKYPVS